ncbi:MAG: peptide chain release factor N(5)-glutamine methyltransferase [Tunicatimonas sp.]
MNQVYKLKELHNQIRKKLAPAFSEGDDPSAITAWLLEHYLSVSRTDLLLNKSVEVSSIKQQRIDQAIIRLLNQEPIQYVLEEAYFYGRKFNVSPGVLIPRRETEELVALVQQENLQVGLKVLDVGTGSGCIAVTLAKEMNHPSVFALEISAAAVQVAQKNAVTHQSEVTFITGDLFHESLLVPAPFNIVVSNPPYVRRSEASAMEARVLAYEPESALFVSDERPLRYYEQIAHRCRNGWLQRGGKLYWEINEALGKEAVALLEDGGFEKVVLRKDMQGKDRFVSATLL